jgi:hypothetical protein
MHNALTFSFAFLFSTVLAAQPMFSNQSGLLSTSNIYKG